MKASHTLNTEVVKTAFKKKFTDAFKKIYNKHPEAVGGVAGAAGMGGLGYGLTHPKLLKNDPLVRKEIDSKAFKKGYKKNSKEYNKLEKNQFKKTRSATTIGLGLQGAFWGAMFGNLGRNASSQYYRSYSRSGAGRAGNYSGSASSMWSKVGLSGQEKTKSEVMKKYKKMAQKHHPDLGGDVEKMKDINASMDNLKQTSWFNKLAFIRMLMGR